MFAQRDQTRQRRDQRADAAYIDTDQKIRIVGRKLRKQHGGRHIADELARNDAENQRVLFQQAGKEVPDRFDPAHIPGKDKEENEREQQRIVDRSQCLPVCEQQNRGNHDQPDPVRDPAEHDGDRKRKQREVQNRFSLRQTDLFIVKRKRLRLDEHDAAERDQRDREQKRRRHDPHELQIGNLEFRVEIQVLRVAERRQHTAEVCGDILHDERERHVFLFARRRQHEKPERKKRQKRHVVRDQHGTDKRDIDETEHAHARIFEQPYDLARKHIEEADVFQRAYDREHAKQAGQRFISI